MAEHEITLIRRINAPVDAVYAAWTDRSVMRQWLGRKVEADVRVGGRYRIENDGGNGTVLVHMGEYRVLEPDRRIVQTFQAGPAESTPAEASPYLDEYLEITFRPLGADQTELTFTNGWNGEPLSEEDRQATSEAWSAWLDLLEKVF